MIWNRFPLVKLFMPFLAGILTASVFSLLWWQAATISMIIFAFLFLMHKLKSLHSYSGRFWFACFAIPAFFFAGIAMRLKHESRVENSAVDSCYLQQQSSFIVKIIGEPQRRPRSWKLEGELIAFADSTGIKSVSSGVLVYLEPDSNKSVPGFGSVLIARGSVQEVSPPSNPGEFNYKKFLKRKGILYQVYVKADEYSVLREQKGFSLKSIAQRARRYLMENLEKNGLESREFAVASAVLLGYDDLLDAEQRKAFSGAGAMHVLCVSGLHVGIVYLVINLLLGKIVFLKKRVWIKAFMIILFIWCYALITGMAPSVLRASTMFSFVVVGKSLGRRTHIYNSLMASAFLLMTIDPLIVYAVGFQLSYLAVAGIVSLQPPIYNLLSFSNTFLDKTWSLIAVSISAQTATFPLALLYFNQFPNYFIITNLVVIPLSSVILYSGLLACALIPVPYLNELITALLSFFIWLMNQSVCLIEAMPGAVTRNAYLSSGNCFIIYMLILAVSGWLIHSQRKMFYLIPFLLMLILFSGIQRKTEIAGRSVICVYNAGRNVGIDFIHGKDAVFLSDSVLISDSNRQGFHFSGNRIRKGVKNVSPLDIALDSADYGFLRKRNHFICFNGFRIVLINSESASLRSNHKLKADVLILTANPRVEISALLSVYDIPLILISADNSFFNTNRWVAALDSLGVEYRNIREEGAWEKTF